PDGVEVVPFTASRRQRVSLQRQPQRRVVGIHKILGHDTDNLERLPIDANDRTYCRWLQTIAISPDCITNYCNLGTAYLIFAVLKDATCYWLHSRHAQ